jgi:hypothetical protein
MSWVPVKKGDQWVKEWQAAEINPKSPFVAAAELAAKCPGSVVDQWGKPWTAEEILATQGHLQDQPQHDRINCGCDEDPCPRAGDESLPRSVLLSQDYLRVKIGRDLPEADTPREQLRRLGQAAPGALLTDDGRAVAPEEVDAEVAGLSDAAVEELLSQIRDCLGRDSLREAHGVA